MADPINQRERLCARCRGPLESGPRGESQPHHCVKCGLGWKPLDRHGLCDRCRRGH